MNILILSAGTRNKIVEYFKKAVGTAGKVVATDMSELAPAVYAADRFYQVPRITEPGYLDRILEICRDEKIDGVLSLIDPELELLAMHEEAFRAVGTCVIGSSYELCRRSMDKFAMYNWLKEHGYGCARSYRTLEAFREAVDGGQIRFPVFVKPVCGSASIAIAKAEDMETAEFLFRHGKDMMIQEFLDGQEIGADVYIDLLSGKPVSIFTKEKLVMRAGETDKAVSFRDEKLFERIARFAEESGFRGQIDIDIFRVNGEYVISEVNPRFGGGYPHAYACGCDHMALIVNNLRGIVNEPRIGDYADGVYMMKYNEIAVIKPEA